MDKNIQESKEYRLAKEWEMAVNSYSFDPRKFAAAIPGMHPTNQQSLYRLVRECLRRVSRSWRTKRGTMTNGTKPRTRKRSASWNISMNTESIYH